MYVLYAAFLFWPTILQIRGEIIHYFSYFSIKTKKVLVVAVCFLRGGGDRNIHTVITNESN